MEEHRMLVRVNQHIKDAIEKGIPVVALESTIISHGMPYPQNVETALKVEEIIKNEGCMPATIGIIDGECVVGMTPEEIEQFGSRKGIAKVSRRDLPVITATKQWGATTVATTMIIAAFADIKVFVTGGIGGVHRGAEKTFDISADLEEFATTNMAVVCAGAKAILDLPLTLEYLETKGVPVLGYQTKELPAFYTRESGLQLDYAIDTPEEFAAIMKAKWEMGLQGGLVICNPIPVEYAMDKAEMDKAIDEALADMEARGIKGKDCTPFLLAAIKDITKGRSLESNIQLVFNNARLGAKIAKAYNAQ